MILYKITVDWQANYNLGEHTTVQYYQNRAKALERLADLDEFYKIYLNNVSFDTIETED